VLANLLANRVDLNQRAIHGLRSRHFAGYPNGEENRAEIPFRASGEFNTADGATRAKIKISVENRCGASCRRAVSTTIDEKVSFLARAEISSASQPPPGKYRLKQESGKDCSQHRNSRFSNKHHLSAIAPAVLDWTFSVCSH